MPSKTEEQRKFIFAKRSQYGSNENTPKDWKWIWESEWEEIAEKLYIPFGEIKGSKQSLNIKKKRYQKFFPEEDEELKTEISIPDIGEKNKERMLKDKN
jgi:hypothetical protein